MKTRKYELAKLLSTIHLLIPLAALALAAAPLQLTAQQSLASVTTVSDTLAGSVGGVAVDRMGWVYIADFGGSVWVLKQDGSMSLFASGMYGASGNTIDSQGNLIQSNFYGGYVTRIDRHGTQEVIAEDLNGPVGVAVDAQDNLYVTNCNNNTLSMISNTGELTPVFAQSTLFRCPNGITMAPNGNLYVVNFSDEAMLMVTPDGTVTPFATIPGGGNGHVAVARGAMYVTSFKGHKLYQVSFQANVRELAGTGTPTELDGMGTEAAFAWPNGIAASANGSRLYVNDLVNRAPPGSPPSENPPAPRFTVRQIFLRSITGALTAGLQSGGIDGMADAYAQWKTDPETAQLQTEGELNAMGYRLMGSGQLDQATFLFKLNVESYPESCNTHDSLGEAYMNADQTELAIEHYEKSLELNPANQNAVKMLARLRGGG